MSVRRLYSTLPRAAWRAPLLLAMVVAGSVAGCRKRPLAEQADEKGKLSRIAERLEEGFGTRPMPPVKEPPKLADRLAKWDDFRECTVRTYIARKRDADDALREGRARPKRHASIGEEVVEECAVQAAVIKKDPSFCERLALDFAPPDGTLALSAQRCWDTRARVLGKPDECPVLWMPNDVVGRNAECLALARRDPSLCAFAENGVRCRALFTGDPAACGQGAAPDCALAATYWSDLVPRPEGTPLFPDARVGEASLVIEADVLEDDAPAQRLEAAKIATAVSWPAGPSPAPPNPTRAIELWGSEIPGTAVALAFHAQPSVRIAFVPSGQRTGARPLQPPGREAGATMVLVWTDPQGARRCAPTSDTHGELRFEAPDPKPGNLVRGTLEADRLACTDGKTVRVSGSFAAPILDLR